MQITNVPVEIVQGTTKTIIAKKHNNIDVYFSLTQSGTDWIPITEPLIVDFNIWVKANVTAELLITKD